MLNKVVHTLSRALNELHVPAVRFNFRGVGASEGAYADGIGETEDALGRGGLGAAAFSRRRTVARGLLLRCRRGYPRRRPAHLPAADQHCAARWRGWATCSPAPGPTARGCWSRERRTKWLLPTTSRPGRAVCIRRPDLVLLPDVDHFFHGRLTLLRDTVVGRVGAAGSSLMLRQLRQFLETECDLRMRRPIPRPVSGSRWQPCWWKSPGLITMSRPVEHAAITRLVGRLFPAGTRSRRRTGCRGPRCGRRFGVPARVHRAPACSSCPTRTRSNCRDAVGRGAGGPDLDKYEDYLIGKVAELLYVSRGDVVRLRYEAGERRTPD